MSEANVALEALGRDLITGFDIMNPVVFFGLLIGAAIPAVFSAMLILGVDKNAQRMVSEIHRQFREIRGLREGKPGVKPEYDRCIDIATSGALKELIPAGLMAIIATLLVGFIGGPLAIGGFLMGNIVSGLLLSLFMSNAGGCGTTPRSTSKRATRAARAPRRTRRPSWATPSATPSRTPQARRSTRRSPSCRWSRR